MRYSNQGETFISRHILHQHWYTCPIALPVLRNPQHRSLLVVVSATSTPPFQSLCHQRNVCHPAVNRFMRQTLPSVNRKNFFMSILCIQSFCSQKRTHTRTLLFISTLLKHGRHFDYWNQPLIMRMHVCYLDSHETGLFCYLVIHIWNLLLLFVTVLLTLPRRFHFQGRIVSQENNQRGHSQHTERSTWHMFLMAVCLASSSTLKMEAICSSETSGSLLTTRRYNPQSLLWGAHIRHLNGRSLSKGDHELKSF
jgi:hypothetical protein